MLDRPQPGYVGHSRYPYFASALSGSMVATISSRKEAAMHTRVVTFTGVKDFEGGIALVRDEVLPVLNEQKGYRGTTVSADRSGGVLGVLSLWDTAADREASFGALAKARQRGVEITGAEMKIESFEELVADINEVPAVGSALMVTRISMEPAKIDANLEFFKNEVLPRIKANDGFQALRNMISRESGERHRWLGVAGSRGDESRRCRGPSSPRGSYRTRCRLRWRQLSRAPRCRAALETEFRIDRRVGSRIGITPDRHYRAARRHEFTAPICRTHLPGVLGRGGATRRWRDSPLVSKNLRRAMGRRNGFRGRHRCVQPLDAELYDRYMVPLLFEPYARVAAERAKRLNPRRVLETAAGTGVLTAIVKAAVPDAAIVATDVNPAVVEFATAKIQRWGSDGSADERSTAAVR